MSQRIKLVRGSKRAQNCGEVVETLTWVQIIWWHVWANGKIVRRWPQWGVFCSSVYRVACVSDSGTADEKLVVAFLVSVTVQPATYCTTRQRSRHSDYVMGWTVRDSNPGMHKNLLYSPYMSSRPEEEHLPLTIWQSPHNARTAKRMLIGEVVI
jgi:hypothetical protein